MALTILCLTAVLFRLRGLLRVSSMTPEAGADALGVTRSAWAIAGAGAIFLYVGAGLTIGNTMVNFLEQRDNLAATPTDAGSLVGFYWFGALVGRSAGLAILSRVLASCVLAVVSLCVAAMCLGIPRSVGVTTGAATLSIGLFNAVILPMIFTFTLEQSRAAASATSGLLCTAIVEGSRAPLLFAGNVNASIRSATFVVPLVCYVAIACFAFASGRARLVASVNPVSAAVH